MKLGIQRQSWAQHIVCKICGECLSGWTNSKLKLNFAVLLVWRDPKYQFDDCYFCLNDMSEFN